MEGNIKTDWKMIKNIALEFSIGSNRKARGWKDIIARNGKRIISHKCENKY